MKSQQSIHAVPSPIRFFDRSIAPRKICLPKRKKRCPNEHRTEWQYGGNEPKKSGQNLKTNNEQGETKEGKKDDSFQQPFPSYTFCGGAANRLRRTTKLRYSLVSIKLQQARGKHRSNRYYESSYLSGKKK